MEATAPPATRRESAGWWNAPQRVWLRRAIFQVHLWVGVVLSLYCVVIGLSGSALVFKNEIEESMHPEVFRVAASPQRVSLAAAMAKIQASHPDWTAINVQDFATPGHAAMAVLIPRKSATRGADIKYVYFNPYTGAVLAERSRYSGVLGWISNLHYFLLSGEKGLIVSGVMAAGLLLLCISGLIVWWPGIARWSSALVMQRRASWRRVNWDLHSVVGFWSCAALTVVSFTGVYFAFPLPVGGAVVLATGGSIQQAKKLIFPVNVAPFAAGARVLSLDEVITVARGAMPPEAPPIYLQIPAKPTDAFSVVGYYKDTAPYSQSRRVVVDPHSGAVLMSVDTHTMPLGLRLLQYVHSVHFGSFAGEGLLGVAVKCVWVLLGIVPALLSVTGLLMYWNRKLRPAWIRMRRA